MRPLPEKAAGALAGRHARAAIAQIELHPGASPQVDGRRGVGGRSRPCARKRCRMVDEHHAVVVHLVPAGGIPAVGGKKGEGRRIGSPGGLGGTAMYGASLAGEAARAACTCATVAASAGSLPRPSPAVWSVPSRRLAASSSSASSPTTNVACPATNRPMSSTRPPSCLRTSRSAVTKLRNLRTTATST